jgi:hypothetical protein
MIRFAHNTVLTLNYEHHAEATRLILALTGGFAGRIERLLLSYWSARDEGAKPLIGVKIGVPEAQKQTSDKPLFIKNMVNLSITANNGNYKRMNIMANNEKKNRVFGGFGWSLSLSLAHAHNARSRAHVRV